jgi:hypothetical protein
MSKICKQEKLEDVNDLEKSKSQVKRRRVKAIETKDIHSLLEPIKVDMNNVLEDQLHIL